MSSALEYQLDTTAPVVTTSVPSGTISKTPISLVFNESEPSDTYYTTDGSTPTTASTQYGFSGFREQEGATITFTHNTTLKWFSVDPKGNTSAVNTATFVVDSTPPTTTANVSNGGQSNHSIVLSPSDDNSGVMNTYYTVDGGGQQTYSGPITLSDGVHTLVFWSVDNAGNVEAAHTVTFTEDATAPTTTLGTTPAAPDGSQGWFLEAVVVTLTATDAPSGVASTQYTVDGGPPQSYSAPFSITTEGSHVVSFWSTDNAGNIETAHQTTIKVDLNNPTSSSGITPAEQGGWYASPTVTLSGSDGSGSGIAMIQYKIDGAASWSTYSGPLTGFSTGNHTVQFFATDNAGRTETPTHLLAFKADSGKPTVNIITPDEGQFIPLDKVVAARFKCAEPQPSAKESGIPLVGGCVGSIANGANLDTSTIGDHTITVTGTDVAGNVTVLTRHYTVIYTWQGFFSVTNEDDMELNLVHAGDLIKVGFGLNGDRGLGVLAAGNPTSVAVACPAWTTRTIPTGGVGTTAGLTYGTASAHYTNGWQTQAGWAGTCRQFRLQTNDGTAPHTAVFMFFA
jgi:hypothetical protein